MAELRMYLRDDRGMPYGVVVSNAPNSYGWAMCNPRDKFCKERGVKIARGREAKIGILTPYHRDPDRKAALEQAIEIMVARSKKYFKDEMIKYALSVISVFEASIPKI